MRTAKQEIKRITRNTARVNGIKPSEVEKIHNYINSLPEAKALREAALAWAQAEKLAPVDSEDSACDLANRNLLSAAVDFTRAVRGEK